MEYKVTKILRKPLFKISLETIEFQDTKFGSELEALVSKIKDHYDNIPGSSGESASRLDEAKKIEELVYKRLGMKIKLVTHTMLAAILPFYSNKNHIFVDEFFRGNFVIGSQDKILAKSADKKGYVDLRNAKLGGVFSEYINPVYMNFKDLFEYYNLTASEVVGVLLHELGHGFEICEYSDRMDTNNQIIADVSKRIAEKKDNDLEYVFREVQKIDKNYTLQQTEDLVNGNRIIGSVRWFQLIVKAAGHDVSKQSSNSKYDETSFETLADNFANRFGYGRHLIVGLNKLYEKGWYPQKSKSAFIFTQIIEIMSFVIFCGLSAVSGPFLMVFFGLVAFLKIATAGEAMKDYTYDELKIRYARVRNDMVEFLKDPNLDKKQVQSVLASIKVTDKIISETNNHKFLFNHMANFFFSGSRAANKAINEQRLIEELVANDLFVKSAELRSM